MGSVLIFYSVYLKWISLFLSLEKKNHSNKTLSRVKFLLPQVEYLISNVKTTRTKRDHLENPKVF